MKLHLAVPAGILLLVTLLHSASAQCTSIANCKFCTSSAQCNECNEGYGQFMDGRYCCDEGCRLNGDGEPACNLTTGLCLYGCRDTFIASINNPPCERCSDTIRNCDNCAYYQSTTTIHCTNCGNGFYFTADFKCCPLGCNSCGGTTGRDCYTCKPGYYLYDNKCDMCGNNCRLPADTTQPRCDGVTGRCLLGCIDGWHGDRCNVSCNLPFCSTCSYNQASNLLTCADCVDGYYGSNCQSCGANCRRLGGTNICDQSGRCVDGCVSGYRQDLCDQRCDEIPGMKNCLVCSRYSLQCSQCKAGYWGTMCELSCSTNCVPNVLSETRCNLTNGACDLACLPKFWKPDCTASCPNCGNDVCAIDTGICRDQVCDAGFFGERCINSCPVHCAHNPNTGLPYCDFASGGCSYGCTYNYHGQFCDKTCSPYCSNGTVVDFTAPKCSQSTGYCNHNCTNGYYQRSCNATCKSTCVDGTCDVIQGLCLECNKTNPGYLCPTGTCPAGFSGLQCQSPCPQFCAGGMCGRYTKICTSCVNGRWGLECSNSCGNCASGRCFQETGNCDGGCLDGFFGDKCITACRHVGCQKCDSTGECTECKQGLFGVNCSMNCSKNCAPNITSSGAHIYCDRATGACSSKACVAGYYSPTCTSACQATCGADTNLARPCDLNTGRCDYACVMTYFGTQCNERCPATCVNQNCDRDGDCREGCKTMYWGAACESLCTQSLTCNNDTCDQQQGNCKECEKTNPSPLCRTAACPTSFWGTFCNRTCPANCEGNICNRDTGTCAACKNGYYGSTCNSVCPNCANNVCFQSSGECVQACVDGWYGLDCKKPCLHAGCQNCERQTGQCVACKTGKFGAADCSQNCSSACLRQSGLLTCNKASGACDSGRCVDGFWTPQCTSRCSDACSTAYCDLQTGSCSPCRIGFYNQMCTGQCSDRCKNKDCVIEADNCRDGCTDGYWGGRCESNCSINCNQKACDKTSGRCLYGCVNNVYYGSMCSLPCGGNCQGGVCNVTGYCTQGCSRGYYNDRCQFACNNVTQCTDGTCDRVSGLCQECNNPNPGPNCPSAGCEPGKRGIECSQDCTSTTCLYNQCDRYNDVCIACPDGRWGPQCSRQCPNCISGKCSQDSGVCQQGCIDGWYGTQCSSQCNAFCKSCGRLDGGCITCAAGRWGASCNLLCSNNCYPKFENIQEVVYCDKAIGACSESRCLVGYWGQQCNNPCSDTCIADANGRRDCELLNGKCSLGCEPKYYGTTCKSLCSERCRDRLCKDFSDSCTTGCADGFYGSTCASSCSTHCAGDGKCDPKTGACVSGCELNYYTATCQSQCINTCTDGACAADGGCPDCKTDPIGPKCRVKECNPGFYGPTCESECPGQYCANGRCHRNSGVCESGCRSGYHGVYCTETCNCDPTGSLADNVCQQDAGICNCKTGRYGTRCDLLCSDGCIGYECRRDGQCSNGCTEGRYGVMCDKRCDKCIGQFCSSSTGDCLSGCIEGYYGIRCDKKCPSGCLTCNADGVCTRCNSTNYGLPACTSICSINCQQVGGGRSCDETGGTCLLGCIQGYYGDRCATGCGSCRDNTCQRGDGTCPQGCRAGYFGNKCTEACSLRCKGSSSTSVGECEQSNGRCIFGCADGYYGQTCSSECSSNCLNRRCSSATQCTDGCISGYYGLTSACRNSCSKCRGGLCSETGQCQNGCEDGNYGTQCTRTCSETCTDNTCDTTDGYCKDCSQSPKGPKCRTTDPGPTVAAPIRAEDDTLDIKYIIVIVVIAALCVIILGIFIVYCCFSRRADDAKNEIHLPSDLLERLSNHQSLHSAVSANYPVARVVGDDEKDFVLF